MLNKIKNFLRTVLPLVSNRLHKLMQEDGFREKLRDSFKRKDKTFIHNNKKYKVETLSSLKAKSKK